MAVYIKTTPYVVDNADVMKRHQLNQYKFAYLFDTENALYKNIQRRLYKLGYDCEIDGNFSKDKMLRTFQEYGTDKYKYNFDFNGITYYTLYNLLFNIKLKVERELEIFSKESSGNHYSIFKVKKDFYNVNSKKLFVLNPLDDYGQDIINRLSITLDNYKTNYILLKQYSLNESLKDRLDRLIDYKSRSNNNVILINIGNAIDYSGNIDAPTLLRGVNIYYNKGTFLGDNRKTEVYARYIAKKIIKYCDKTMEYVRIEENNKLPTMSYIKDIPSITLELGYKNNPIDKIILNTPEMKNIFTNTLCHSIQRIDNFKDTRKYVQFNDKN